MKEELLNKLVRIRNNKTEWEKLKNSPKQNPDEYEDSNYQNREEILIALQFHRKDKDEELIKFLFEEEIKDRRKDPFQGNTESLNRAGHLLATFKKPKYVWLFLKAKNANFDTHCGFDWEHILSAGVKKTFEYVEKSNQSEKEDFYEFFPNEKECELSESDITQWHQNKSIDFPNNPNEEDIEFWIDIALSISNTEEAKRLINKFESHVNKNEESLRALKYYKGRIKDFAGQIEIIEQLIKKPYYEHNIIADYFELSKVYLENNQAKKSWETIQTAIEKCDLSNKYMKGLFSEQAVKIVMNSNLSKQDLESIYDFAMNNYGNILPLVKLEEYYECAKKMKDEKNQKLFHERYKEEKKRIDEMMK